MEGRNIYIEAINLTARLVLIDTGETYPITNFYDCGGEPCEPDEALQAVAGAGDVWFTFDPHDDFEPLTVH